MSLKELDFHGQPALRLALPEGDSSHVLEDWGQRLCLKGSFAEAGQSLEMLLGLRVGSRAPLPSVAPRTPQFVRQRTAAGNEQQHVRHILPQRGGRIEHADVDVLPTATLVAMVQRRDDREGGIHAR